MSWPTFKLIRDGITPLILRLQRITSGPTNNGYSIRRSALKSLPEANTHAIDMIQQLTRQFMVESQIHLPGKQ